MDIQCFLTSRSASQNCIDLILQNGIHILVLYGFGGFVFANLNCFINDLLLKMRVRFRNLKHFIS